MILFAPDMCQKKCCPEAISTRDQILDCAAERGLRATGVVLRCAPQWQEAGLGYAEAGLERIRSRRSSGRIRQWYGAAAFGNGGIQACPTVDQEGIEQGSYLPPQPTAAVYRLPRFVEQPAAAQLDLIHQKRQHRRQVFMAVTIVVLKTVDIMAYPG